MSTKSLRAIECDQAPYQREREELAAVFRWVARLDMHEGIANHFSLERLPARFLAFWRSSCPVVEPFPGL